MRKFSFVLLFCAVAALCASAQTAPPSSTDAISIEQCVESARANYPVIRKYDLLRQTSTLNLEEINTAWYPRLALTAQTTWQNAVPTFPDTFSKIMSQMGTEMKGVPHWQYHAGVELSQNLYDGGVSAERRRVDQASLAAQTASLDADMYAVRERVESLFFSLLLIRDQIEQTDATLALLSANLERVRAMVKDGVALPADADMIEAQLLTLTQQRSQATCAADGYVSMLSLFTGMPIEIDRLSTPSAAVPSLSGDTDDFSQRPEMLAMTARKDLNLSNLRLSDTALRPKLGLFAQGFYGDPGLDNFKSMMERKPSFNLMGGVKLSWNIDSWYTHTISRHKTLAANAAIEAERDALLLNLRLQARGQRAAIEGIERVSAEDARILQLRTNVRLAAESQLRNGVLDATALLSKITDENIAALTMRYHRIQLLQEIYKLRYILNQ